MYDNKFIYLAPTSIKLFIRSCFCIVPLYIVSNYRTMPKPIWKNCYNFLLFFSCCFAYPGLAQTTDSSITLVAGAEYQRSKLHQALWGRHYRTEWSIPVKVPLFFLDTAQGGLIPYAAGGGRQSKTLRLRNNLHREYVLRSINKSFGKALDPIFQKTFVEKLMNDQVSIAHPYAAFTIAPMAEAAGIYHTWPKLVYLPEQKALDSFNKDFANTLYLFEQRPDENWEEAANFGHAKKIIGTDALIEKLLSSNSNQVDQELYVRSRLFDMFAGDWGRHEDQWRWGKFEEGELNIYRPIPRDRDQAYTLFDGFLLGVVKSLAGLNHLQSFDSKIKDVETYNFPARNLDRMMANAVTKDQWLRTAQLLQGSLTDTLIENAVQQMPAEVFPVSGPVIIAKLKSRRDQLKNYALDYYHFLAKEVQITGSEKAEYFEVRDSAGGLSVKVFDKKDQGKGKLVYDRYFLPEETKEIRIFGISGKDVWDVQTGQNAIHLRLVGGNSEDTYSLSAAKRIDVYDSQAIPVTGAKMHVFSDSLLPKFTYDAFQYSKNGFSPTVMYNRDDRLFVGFSYKTVQRKWRRGDFAHKHEIFARYSINQKAAHLGYKGIVNQVFGPRWNMLLQADYDWVKWYNFYGVGNSSIERSSDRDFHRLRTKEANASIGLQHLIGQQSQISFSPFYQSVQVIKDTARYFFKSQPGGSAPDLTRQKHFGGAALQMNLRHLDDPLIPHKGFSFEAVTAHTRNLKVDSSFTHYGGDLQVYLPLGKSLVFVTQLGAATVDGQPEIYQLPNIGGRTLRGYRRERFWGQSVVHNNNELQYLFNFRSHLFNGTAGIVGFFDQGKVFGSEEMNRKMHTAYGGGFIIAPFNKVYISLLYGITNDPTSTGNLRLDLRRNIW